MKPFIIGHRGAMAYEPENTLRSVKKAIDLGVDGVEIDIRRCKSGEIVVFHDEKVDRTTNGKGFVKDLSLKELKKLDAGKGEHIITLEELIKYKQIKLVIELKDKDIENDVADLIEKYDIIEGVMVIAFYHRFVKNIEAINKKIKTGILFVGNPIDAVKLAKDADAEFLFPNFNYVDENLVENAHKNNLKVFVWNVDDVENVEKMLKLNVDGIGSNKPDVVVEYLKSKMNLNNFMPENSANRNTLVS